MSENHDTQTDTNSFEDKDPSGFFHTLRLIFENATSQDRKEDIQKQEDKEN
ncbi:MAG TPA: hypothetical protein PKJ08_08445 [Candidatus Cloacimonadota bacterium]|nr:hypothetical protein [Candidatus Cloacimonadota bacterium]HOD54539.1 hypothetical protein [Candidatus Cloacimonadota bacterium]